MATRRELAIELSKLKVFESVKPKLEQYPTDSDVAADVLWQAFMQGDIEGKEVVDLGCGTGILGIGALLLGAKKVYFVDVDKKALETCKDNLSDFEDEYFEVIQSDVKEVSLSADVVIQNPPFGTREEHIDVAFLETAFTIAPLVYSFHKTTTLDYIQTQVEKNGFGVAGQWDFAFPLKATLEQHKRKIHRIEVSCLRIEKKA